MQQLRHTLARSGEIGGFRRSLGFDGFGERRGSVAREDNGQLFWPFFFQLGEHVGPGEASSFKIASAAERTA